MSDCERLRRILAIKRVGIALTQMRDLLDADAVDMPREAAAMHRYFSDEAWPIARRFYEEWPGEHWVALYREIAAAIPDGPTAHAEELVDRWNTLAQALWRDLTTDRNLSRQLHEGFARAWRDRHNWPDVIRRRFADYRMDEVAAFLGRVSAARRVA